MSDKRATYAIGAIVAAFALVIGMVAGSTSLTTISITSQDPMQMSGHVILTLADPDGNIIAYRQTDNIITNVGKNCVADDIFGTTTVGTFLCASAGLPGDFVFIGIGTGFATPQLGDTVLGNEINTRAGEMVEQTAATSSTGALKIIKGTFVLTGEATVNEVALFDSATTGNNNMFSLLEITPVISGGDGDTIKITYEVEVGKP